MADVSEINSPTAYQNGSAHPTSADRNDTVLELLIQRQLNLNVMLNISKNHIMIR